MIWSRLGHLRVRRLCRSRGPPPSDERRQWDVRGLGLRRPPDRERHRRHRVDRLSLVDLADTTDLVAEAALDCAVGDIIGRDYVRDAMPQMQGRLHRVREQFPLPK